MRTAVLALAALLLTAAAAPATPIGVLDEADQAAVEALALYDEATTHHALQAVTEADVLSDVVFQQERSRERFRQLLSPYPREVQEQLFEITRYPELIAGIVEGGLKSGYELETISAPYPEETRAAALAAGSSHWKVLARIDALLRDESSWLEARIAHLPEAKREAFRALVATPELLALLAENATLAVLLGDAYEREPEAVIAWLAAVRYEAQERSAEEARAFAQGVEDSPELAREVAAATIAYQQETGYSAYQPTVVHQTQIYVRPYSYWVGYPWWYDASYGYYSPWYYWYPRSYWAFGSFYFGPRLVVSFGVPHGGFWGWFFHRPIHHHHYPRVTHHVVQHYDRHHGPRHHGYRHDRHGVRHHHAAVHAVSRFRRDAERPKHDRGERRPGKLAERKPRASGGGFARRVPPQRVAKAERRRDRPQPRLAERRQPSERVAKAERRLDRPKPRLTERRQPSERVRATRIARTEPATRSNTPQRRVEEKRRPAPRHRVEERRPQRPQQQARPAPRAPEPRQMQPKRPRRIQNERAQPTTRHQVKREQRKAVNRINARRGGSRRSAR
jgi:hypothetical protein